VSSSTPHFLTWRRRWSAQGRAPKALATPAVCMGQRVLLLRPCGAQYIELVVRNQRSPRVTNFCDARRRQYAHRHLGRSTSSALRETQQTSRTSGSVGFYSLMDLSLVCKPPLRITGHSNEIKRTPESTCLPNLCKSYIVA